VIYFNLVSIEFITMYKKVFQHLYKGK